jgi:hypothetical protein
MRCCQSSASLVTTFPLRCVPRFRHSPDPAFWRDHAAIFQQGFQLGFIQNLETLRRSTTANPFCQVSSIGVSSASGTTGKEPILLRSRARYLLLFGAGAVDHDQPVNGVDPHHRLAKAAKSARQQKCSIFQRIFFGFFSLRPCSASSLKIFASSACFTTGVGRIFSSASANDDLSRAAGVGQASLCEPIGGTQPVFAISWLPQGKS